MNHLRDAVRDFITRVKVYETGLTKLRLGNEGDGGYVVLEELCQQVGSISSYGIGDDVGFELDFVERWPHVEVRMFDPFLDAPPVYNPRFRFHKSGAGTGYPGGLMISDLLKMDVEGDEWSAFKTLDWMTLFNYQQVVVEFHVFHVIPPNQMTPYFNKVYKRWADDVNARYFQMYSSILGMLNTHFVCYHAHVNNSLPLVELGGLWFPPLLEMSFARRALVGHCKPYVGSLPISGLDWPNKADRPDVLDWYPLIRRGNGLE